MLVLAVSNGEGLIQSYSFILAINSFNPYSAAMRAARALDSWEEATAALLLRVTRLRAVMISSMATGSTRISTKPDSPDTTVWGLRRRAIGLEKVTPLSHRNLLDSYHNP